MTELVGELEELPARSERPSHFLTGPVQVTASVWRQDGPDGPDWFQRGVSHGICHSCAKSPCAGWAIRLRRAGVVEHGAGSITSGDAK